MNSRKYACASLTTSWVSCSRRGSLDTFLGKAPRNSQSFVSLLRRVASSTAFEVCSLETTRDLSAEMNADNPPVGASQSLRRVLSVFRSPASLIRATSSLRWISVRSGFSLKKASAMKIRSFECWKPGLATLLKPSLQATSSSLRSSGNNARRFARLVESDTSH